jgi:hypothetical protein
MRDFGYRVLRRIFSPEREKVRGGCRKKSSEEHHNLFSSRRIIKVMKLRRMGWAGHVAHVVEKRNAYTGFWRERQKKNGHM